MRIAEWAGLVVLGGTGAVLRFQIDDWVGRRLGGELPWGTFAVNVAGTFALGLLTGARVADGVLFVVGTGLLGSYTTFSTWMFETHRLAEDGESGNAWLNVVLSLAAGLGAAALGWWIGSAS